MDPQMKMKLDIVFSFLFENGNPKLGLLFSFCFEYSENCGNSLAERQRSPALRRTDVLLPRRFFVCFMRVRTNVYFFPKLSEN
jgi:hypothetical protein